MPWAEEWQPGAKVQCLVYAPSKAGKTFGAYTFPRPVVMDFDKGIAVASNPEFIKQWGLRKIFYEQFQELNVKGGVYTNHNAFDDACRFFDEWMKPSGKWKGVNVGVNMFDTWILDSGTTMSEFAQNKAVVLLGKPGVWGKNPLSSTHETALKLGLVVPKIQDYGAERSLVEQFVDMLLSSGKHVVMLCHEKTTISEDSGSVLSIEPLLTGKSSEVVPLKFDEVYNLRVKKDGPGYKRYLQTQADGIRKVGSRYGVPNETLWSFDALSAALTSIREQRDNLKATSQQPAAPTGAKAPGV